MKKYSYFLALPVLSVCLSTAHAQSSVTLYGLIDSGLTYVHDSNGKSTQIAASSGNIQGSRWGLKGTEDLGGGLKAIFKLENGFSATNGNLLQSGRMFGRSAYVGLSNSTWGVVTLGRQYDPVVDLVQPVQGDNWLGGTFTSPGDVDNADNSVRVNNAVKWASPNWSGVQFETLYSFGGVAGSTGSGQTYSGAASYTRGPLALAAGYWHVDNGNATLSTRSTTSADSFFRSAVNDAFSSARAISITRAGGSYALGPVTFGGFYSFSEYTPDANSKFADAEKYHNGEVYGVWQVTSALQGEVGYDYLRSLGNSSAKQSQFSAGAAYSLSKLTNVYAIAAYAHASGTDGAGPAQAVIGSNDIDSGSSKQALVIVGIRHKF